MSLTSKMAEFEQANKALNEQVATLEAAVMEKDGAIDAMTAEHKAKITELSAKVIEIETAKAEDIAKIEAIEAENIAVKAELETAKATLSNPAYKAASAEGADGVEPGAAEGEKLPVDDKAEAQAKIDEYLATEEGQKRSRWLAEHGKELQAAFNLLNVEG